VADVTSTVDGVADNFKITGNGATTVSVADKTITVTSIDEHTTKAGHYDPSADASAELALTNEILTKVSRDDNGHVTGISGAASQESLSSAVSGGTNEATFTYTAKNVFGVDSGDSIKIKGDGATKVEGDGTNKTITITSTDQSVAAAEYHYSPTAVEGSKLSLSKQILSEVARDDKGHITSISGVDTKEDITHSITSYT
jgi:predicted Zn-dependent protease